MTDEIKRVSFNTKSVQLILANPEMDIMAAEASISLNRHVTWMKIVLADDGFNANKQRIPQTEFANVIRTGIYMPVKMTKGKINTDHTDSEPLGVMAHIKANGNTLEALAALWNTERTEDIEFLKKKYSSGEPIDVSWELTYTSVASEDGGEALKDVCMNAATIVGAPAYQGRTPVVALSSDDNNENVGDNIIMEITLEQHESAMTSLKSQYDATIAELNTKLSDASTKLTETETKLSELTPKYEELASFKQAIDAQEAKAARLDAIKAKFTEAKLTVDEKYITEKADKLMGYSDEQLDFFIQELVAAMDSEASARASKDEAISVTSKLPRITRPPTEPVDNEAIVKFLREKK
jgi:hypothetical protein